MNKPRTVSQLIARSLAILALLIFSDRALAEERVDSRYTSTARAKALSFKDESNIPEGGFEAVFAGLGGYKLVHLAGDERSWINVRFGKETVDLYSATMEAGGGTFLRRPTTWWNGAASRRMAGSCPTPLFTGSPPATMRRGKSILA
jgi:hypothetical protein